MTLNINIKYRLSTGSIKDDPIAVYRLKQGLLDSWPAGGANWNPLYYGQTTVVAKFFYTYRDLANFTENQSGVWVDKHTVEVKINGINLWLEYDVLVPTKSDTSGEPC